MSYLSLLSMLVTMNLSKNKHISESLYIEFLAFNRLLSNPEDYESTISP